MTTYYDYAFDCADINNFLPLLSEPNIIGPDLGRADIAGSDPTRFYIRIRSLVPLAPPAGCMVTDTAVADAVLGVWA